MNTEPEHLDAIIAEMRRANFQPQFYQRCVNEYADRIEAAAERERIERDKVSFRCGDCAEFGGDCDAGDMDGNEDCIACEKFRRRSAPGNAAAMREALLSVRKPIAYRGGDLARYTLPVIDAALKTPPEPAGNAAMMRMALEVLWDVIDQFSNNILDGQMQLVLSDRLIPAQNAYHHAIAAPARNCDRFATAEEAVAAFADHLRARENAHGIHSEYPDHPVQVPAGAFAWLFAPAEGGAE